MNAKERSTIGIYVQWTLKLIFLSSFFKCLSYKNIISLNRRIANTESYNLAGLYPDTIYYVWLAARSQRGEGATTPPIPVLTKQHGKHNIYIVLNLCNQQRLGYRVVFVQPYKKRLKIKYFWWYSTFYTKICHSCWLGTPISRLGLCLFWFWKQRHNSSFHNAYHGTQGESSGAKREVET